MFKFVAFLAMLAWSLPALALESGWKTADYVQEKLSSGIEGAGQEAQFDAAIEIRLAKGWHAYWRMPGEGGLPPAFDWSGSINVKKVDIEWPTPKRFVTDGLTSIGYEEAIAFPLTITPEKPGETVKLNLKSSIMVCNEICVPQEVAVALAIPAGAAQQSRTRAIIEHMRANVPIKDDLPSLKIDSVVLGPDAIAVHAYALRGFDQADLFVESGDLYITARPEITLDKDDARSAMMRIAKPEGMDNLAKALAGRTLTLTLTDGRQAIEKSFPF